MAKVPVPELEKISTCIVKLDKIYPLGDIGIGTSEIVSFSGGSAEGVISGDILPFGGDIGLLHNDNVNELNTKFVIAPEGVDKAEENCNILVEITGKLILTEEEMMTVTEDDKYYYMQSVKMTTGHEKYKWLNDVVAIANSIIGPEGSVITDIYKVV